MELPITESLVYIQFVFVSCNQCLKWIRALIAITSWHIWTIEFVFQILDRMFI